MRKHAGVSAALGLGVTALAPIVCAARAPKGYRIEGMARGLGQSASTLLGAGAGLGGGAWLGNVLSRSGKPLIEAARGARIGGTLGLLGGAVAGGLGMHKFMGTPYWKTPDFQKFSAALPSILFMEKISDARAPFSAPPSRLRDYVQDGISSKELLEKIYAHPEKQVGVHDVLDGTSMTVPHSALRIGGGAAAGGLAGNLLGHLFAPHENEHSRRARRVTTGVGTVLGGAYAARPELKALVDQVRAKLSL